MLSCGGSDDVRIDALPNAPPPGEGPSASSGSAPRPPPTAAVDGGAKRDAGALAPDASTEAGAPVDAARSWWVSYLTQQANTRGVELADLPITPAQVAQVVALIDSGKLNNKVARQVVDHVLAGEGDPEEILVAHPELVVVRDDSKLQAAVDEALAANPDIAEKIRSGKVQAAGKIVGDVMKATRGQADPARVKELVIAACS